LKETRKSPLAAPREKANSSLQRAPAAWQKATEETSRESKRGELNESGHNQEPDVVLFLRTISTSPLSLSFHCCNNKQQQHQSVTMMMRQRHAGQARYHVSS
jgi:hypothetical protein